MPTVYRLVAALFLCSFITSQAQAISDEKVAKRQCLFQTNAQFRECSYTCKNERRDARLECGGNPDCHKACNAELESCLMPYTDALKSCTDSCTDVFTAGKDSCKATVGCVGDCYKNADFLACIRPLGVSRYNCAQDCRDTQRLDTAAQDGIALCKGAAKDCHKSCSQPQS